MAMAAVTSSGSRPISKRGGGVRGSALRRSPASSGCRDRGGRTLEQAGAETLAFIREHCPVERTVPLCGNSIGTDRRFLAKYLPEIEDYRQRTLEEAAERGYVETLMGRRRPLPDLASGNFAAVISIEPVPDNDPAPFQLKPLAGAIMQDATGGCVANQTSATFPSADDWPLVYRANTTPSVSMSIPARRPEV